MFDIADKDELIQTVVNEVGYSNIHLNIHAMTNMDDIKNQVEAAIDNHIGNVIRSIINHLYTNQEFESDVGLSKA